MGEIEAAVTPPAPAPAGDLLARALEAIQRVGFPVVAALGLGYGFYRVVEQQREDLITRIESRLGNLERLCGPSYPFPRGGNP